MRLGLIGFGNIGATLLDLMQKAGLAPSHLAVLVRPGREGSVPASAGAVVVTNAKALLAETPDLVVECAGHAAVSEHGPVVLRAGVDMVQVSVGAMSDPTLEAQLRAAAEEGGARIVLHLANAMKRLSQPRGVATECIGGGLGGAMLLEAV